VSSYTYASDPWIALWLEYQELMDKRSTKKRRADKNLKSEKQKVWLGSYLLSLTSLS